jgi:L-2-hydroxyglutarate oxidase
MSIYSVPKYPEYPFLDPHWIVRAHGRREIGPNAVPVFSPYGYDWRANAASYIPKIIEIMRSGAHKMAFDTQFLSLAVNEVKSSLSKSAMIERAREFLPQIEPAHFHKRGTAGIRSSLVGKDGKFVPDTMFFREDNALHILNYNSPGATGALPIAAMLTDQLSREGIVIGVNSKEKSLWDVQRIAEYMLA